MVFYTLKFKICNTNIELYLLTDTTKAPREPFSAVPTLIAVTLLLVEFKLLIPAVEMLLCCTSLYATDALKVL